MRDGETLRFSFDVNRSNGSGGGSRGGAVLPFGRSVGIGGDKGTLGCPGSGGKGRGSVGGGAAGFRRGGGGGGFGEGALRILESVGVGGGDIGDGIFTCPDLGGIGGGGARVVLMYGGTLFGRGETGFRGTGGPFNLSLFIDTVE